MSIKVGDRIKLESPVISLICDIHGNSVPYYRVWVAETGEMWNLPGLFLKPIDFKDKIREAILSQAV